jgi:thioredoxin-related protein
MKKLMSIVTTSCFLFGGLGLCSGSAALAGTETKQQATKEKTPEKITWFSYDEGLARAKKEEKHILIDFYTDWCGWCKKMDRSTFVDGAVVDFVNNNMIAVKVNAESRKPVTHQDQQLTERILSRNVYGARGFPTYFFLNPQGKALFKVSGYRGAAEFLSLIEYVGESHYEKLSFAAFMEARKNGKKPTK